MIPTRRLRGALERVLSAEEQKNKINETRKLIGPIANKFPDICSDASILRYLRARNLNTKKASKMLKETLKWRLECKPEKITWEDVAQEAKTGKLYRANYFDKHGRTVLVMRPGVQNTSSVEGQIKHLLYCMERAIMTLKPDHEQQMIWLIDLQGLNMATLSVKVTRETARVLQNHYPERLGLAIFYNPPKVFESFWLMVKPFLEPKTYKKVKFVNPHNPQSLKMMDELFDKDKLEPVFGGKNTTGFDYEAYGKCMQEEDKRFIESLSSGCSSPCPMTPTSESSSQSELFLLEVASGASEDPNSSGDESGSSNLESIDDKIENLTLSSKDGENVVPTAKDEMKLSEQK